MSNKDKKLSKENNKSEVVNLDDIEPIENNLLPELINITTFAESVKEILQ